MNALKLAVIFACAWAMSPANAYAAVAVEPSSPAPTAEASLTPEERLYREAVRSQPFLRRIHDGWLAISKLFSKGPSRDPDLALADDSVSTMTWSTNDESVSQAIETRDGTIYAITNHSRGYTGDDRFSVAIVTKAGFRDLPLPEGVAVVDLEAFQNGGTYVVVRRRGYQTNFGATFSENGLRIRVALTSPVGPRMRLPSNERPCPSVVAAIRANAATASDGISMDSDVDLSCAVIGDLGFVSLSAAERHFTYVVDGRGFRPFSTWNVIVAGRDALLFSNSVPIQDGQGIGFRDSFVLMRARTPREPSPPPGV